MIWFLFLFISIFQSYQLCFLISKTKVKKKINKNLVNLIDTTCATSPSCLYISHEWSLENRSDYTVTDTSEMLWMKINQNTEPQYCVLRATSAETPPVWRKAGCFSWWLRLFKGVKALLSCGSDCNQGVSLILPFTGRWSSHSSSCGCWLSHISWGCSHAVPRRRAAAAAASS